jgi:hypothetical protein
LEFGDQFKRVHPIILQQKRSEGKWGATLKRNSSG